MISKTLKSSRQFIAALFFAFVLSVFAIAGPGGDYPHQSVAELIDGLTQIDSQPPGINSAAIYEGLLAENATGPFKGGVLGIAPPKVPSQMSELVRRGPLALPHYRN